MSTFTTEFPVADTLSKLSLVPIVLDWVKGIKGSTLVGEAIPEFIDEDQAELRGPNGESLGFKSVDIEHGFVAGARHSICDDLGREWRTEVVLTNRGTSASLRIRGQCIAVSADVEVVRPKRPYLVKKVLELGWGARDGEFDVQSLPHYLDDNDFELACAIVLGKQRASLPVVYLSRNSRGRFDTDESKLAYDLGGVAHVVVEPSMEFSFKLSDLVARKNPYAGNVGISTSRNGVLKNFFLGGSLFSRKLLDDAIKNSVETLVSNRSVMGGFDWLDLQERHAAVLRARIFDLSRDGKIVLDDWIAAFEAEIAGYKSKIRELEVELRVRDEREVVGASGSDGIIAPDLIAHLGAELFPGEFSDRLLYIVSLFNERSLPETDIRTQSFARALYDACDFSGRAGALVSDLKRAAASGKKFGAEMKEILSRHGYIASQEGGHIKMSPPTGAISGPVVTLPKTPSDIRGGKNQASDVAKALGLKMLRKPGKS